MSIIECYTDASYCPQTKLGCVCFDVYIDSNSIHSAIHKYYMKKNSELEKLVIHRCIEYCENEYPSSHIIIYTDCESALKETYPNNVEVLWTKGHSKNSLRDENGMRFKIVDKRARKELRALRKDFTENELLLTTEDLNLTKIED